MKRKLLLCCLIVLPMACSKDKQSEPKVEKFALEYSIQEREDAYAKMYPYLKVVNKRYTLDLTEEQADTLGVPVALYREALADVEAVNQSFDKAEEEGISSSNCLAKTQVYAKPKGEVYGLTPARCWKVKRRGVIAGSFSLNHFKPPMLPA